MASPPAGGSPPASEVVRKFTTASTAAIGAASDSDYRVACFGFCKGEFNEHYIPTIEEQYQQLEAEPRGVGADHQDAERREARPLRNPIVLVGNKKDEQQRREVKTETGQTLASRWGCGFIETSAKNNENITQLFELLLSLEKKRHLALSTNDDESKETTRKTTLFVDVKSFLPAGSPRINDTSAARLIAN
ncbi:GTP-binding protein Di-Ras3 [Aphelenchoides fujianensis]|nr:GTP-binding protein Di-Ras3 [Aphelenchoides fujianensis]